MSYPLNYPTPQNANVQIFYASATSGETPQTWVKPQGASFVWFTLIGAGGTGDGGTGGGSGAVTNFMGPAFLIPDNLSISVAQGGSGRDTYIYYQLAVQTILYASSGTTTGGGSAGNNFFTAMGFFQSTTGQSGTAGVIGASSTTFLSGGGATSVTANYGYTVPTNGNGFFQISPIIVGTGGSGAGTGGIGCGGGYLFGTGGDGLAVIITW